MNDRGDIRYGWEKNFLGRCLYELLPRDFIKVGTIEFLDDENVQLIETALLRAAVDFLGGEAIEPWIGLILALSPKIGL